MIVGFTGTRHALTPHQQEELEYALEGAAGETLLHGDCVGGDAYAHDLGREKGYTIEVYPPRVDTYRAYKVGDIVHPVEDYRVRNQMIADRCDVLVAVPEGPESQFPRSGTWMTVRMARKQDKPIIVILPEKGLCS